MFMGTTDRKKRERESRENEIIQAAKELFTLKGYENTSIDDIAAMVELSKGTIYLYFESKDALFYAVSKSGLALMRDMFKNAVKEQELGLSQFAAIGLSYADFWERYPEYHHLLHRMPVVKPPEGSGPHGKEYASLSEEIMGIMVRSIEVGIDDGSVRSGLDPKVVAFCISSSLQGVLEVWEASREQMERMGMRREHLIMQTMELYGQALIDPKLAQKCSIDEVMNRISKSQG
jgi:AcrR family transcriptional regulator